MAATIIRVFRLLTTKNTLLRINWCKFSTSQKCWMGSQKRLHLANRNPWLKKKTNFLRFLRDQFQYHCIQMCLACPCKNLTKVMIRIFHVTKHTFPMTFQGFINSLSDTFIPDSTPITLFYQTANTTLHFPGNGGFLRVISLTSAGGFFYFFNKKYSMSKYGCF